MKKSSKQHQNSLVGNICGNAELGAIDGCSLNVRQLAVGEKTKNSANLHGAGNGEGWYQRGFQSNQKQSERKSELSLFAPC
jgi:hypothetical protein